MKAQNTSNKLSRRNWLRDTALTATGVAVLPSLLNSCIEDHRIPPGVGVGSPQDAPPTTAELANAAQNLDNMRDWLEHLHTRKNDYMTDMFLLIESGTEGPSGLADFIIDILLKIAIGIIAAAAVAAEAVTAGVAGAAVIATLGIASVLIKKFAFPDSRTNGLLGTYAEFRKGQDDLFNATDDALLILRDETDNYKNLREKWTEEIDFNGKKYTLRDVATAQFPSEKDGTVYVALLKVAFDQFRKYFWNLMITKAGWVKWSHRWGFDPDSGRAYWTPARYGREKHYTEDSNKSSYLRGWWDGVAIFSKLYITFDGRELPPAAAKELFKDDTPGHIINPDGLFNRDYVFKQFRTEKLDFLGYHDVRKDLDWGIYSGDAIGFDLPDDYVLTGGEFPELIKK